VAALRLYNYFLMIDIVAVGNKYDDDDVSFNGRIEIT